MLNPREYQAMDALALASGLRAGEFSSQELVATAIHLAEQHNPTLNAIVSSHFDQATALAAELDKTQPGSDLAGLPFLIKDLSACRDMPLEYGSALYAGHIAEQDSRIVGRYRDAGLVFLGKTNTPEFGLTVTTEPVRHGPTRNPWNPEFSSGGSSGGAAAAVAAGIVPVAHASDGGGSIRIPASCCGLFGLKPSRGLTVIEADLGDCWSGMSVGHVLSRSVRDSAAFLDLITLAGADLFPLPAHPEAFASAHQQAPPALRIALQTQHPQGLDVDPDCIAATEHSANLCEQLGHSVETVNAPVDYRPLTAAMNTLILVHTWQSVSRRLRELEQSFASAPMEHSTRFMAELGAKIGADEYVRARDTLAAAQRDMARFHETYPVLLSPVLSKPPAPIGWLNMNDADQAAYGKRYRSYTGFTALCNGTGQPSMSVPLYRDRQRLPLGSLFSADWGNDLLLLQLARQLENAQPWPLTAP